MKKVIIALVFLSLCTYYVYSKECRTISDWQGYFAERLNILDPIEGIYDIQMKIGHEHGYEHGPIGAGDGTVAIARISGGLFAMYSITGDDNECYFTRVGNTRYYYLTSARWKVRERLLLSNDGSFEIEHKKSDSFSYLGYIIKTINISGIKIFPDETTVQSALHSSLWCGSGFAIGDGYVVTNHHVAGEAEMIKVYDDVQGKSYSAHMVASDPRNDLAIVKVEESSFSGYDTLPYIIEDKLANVASDCFLMGYPEPTILGREIKYTNGTITSLKGFQDDVSTYQISAPATNGNSGGPTFDSDGNVIGVLSSGIKILPNVAYSVKASYLSALMNSNSMGYLLEGTGSLKGLSRSEMFNAIKPYVYFLLCTSETSWGDGKNAVNKSPYTWELPKPIVKPDLSQLKLDNERHIRILEIRDDGEIDAIRWKTIHVTLKANEYVQSIYKSREDRISEALLPVFVDGFNECAGKLKSGHRMVSASSRGADIGAILEIFLVDKDDGEVYATISFFKGDEKKAEIYLNADAGRDRGEALLIKSEDSIEGCAINLAKMFAKQKKKSRANVTSHLQDVPDDE